MKPIVTINLKEFIKFLLKLIFFLFLNYSFAQNIIKAEIIDEKTSKSVSYASVEFLGTFKGIIADYNGQFSLPLSKIKGITKIKISSIGYEKLEINLDSLSTTKFNVIKLKQKIEELDNVILKLTTKELTAKEIVRKAVKSIESNLSKLPHSYIGYYRDYQIYKNGDYYNLNEGIIEQFDKGILSHKLFDNENQSVLYLFKPNLNYKVDYYLASAYNDKDKYIQDFKIFNFGGNELSILNAHNPIRIFNDKSFSYVNNLEADFFLNHTFKKGKVFKAENEKFITIHFKGRKSKIYSKHKVEGKIIISLYDYSIHNFKYIIYKNIEKTPILNIDIAYKKRNDFMYLNYMSFNNKFYIEEKEVFKEKESIFNEEDGRFEIEFNSNVNLKTLKKSNFKVSYNDKKKSISKIKILDNKNIYVYVKKVKGKNGEKINLSLAIRNVRDENNRIIYKKEKKAAYQFREFFVQEVFEEKVLNSEIKFIHKLKPLSESKINTLDNIENFIINSPLMKRKL